MLKIWSPDLAISEIDFTSSAFWIQVHGLPPSWYNKGNITLVGAKAGSVVDTEISEASGGLWQRFARVRVNINVNNPLCPRVFLPRNERNDIWISLKYERLPEVCFRCGIIGHTEAYCESDRVVLSNEFGGKFAAFGEWLNIGNDRTPPGIYEKPPEVVAQEIMPINPVLEVAAPALMQKILVEKAAVQAPETAGQREDTPCAIGNDKEDRAPAMSAVSSFARLLEHSLKDVCPDSNSNISVSHIETLQVGNKSTVGSESGSCHSAGPNFCNDPLSPLRTHTMAQPNMMLEPTDQFTLSLQSQVPSTPEHILAHLSQHITKNTKSLDTKF